MDQGPPMCESCGRGYAGLTTIVVWPGRRSQINQQPVSGSSSRYDGGDDDDDNRDREAHEEDLARWYADGDRYDEWLEFKREVLIDQRVAAATSEEMVEKPSSGRAGKFRSGPRDLVEARQAYLLSKEDKDSRQRRSSRKNCPKATRWIRDEIVRR